MHSSFITGLIIPNNFADFVACLDLTGWLQAYNINVLYALEGELAKV